MTSLWPQIEPLLPRVQKPARYIGCEDGMASPQHGGGRVAWLLAYPDTYEVGLPNQGLQILYEILNERSDAVAERTYAPWPDLEAELRRAGLPLFSVDTHRSAADFDILAFNLSAELVYTNMLNMIDLAGTPVRAAERGDDDQFIIIGGHAAFNPEPLADFIDVAVLGEGEEVVGEITEIVHASREHEDISLGGSPRASLAMFRTAQALAAVRERDYVEPDDVKRVAAPVLVHRLILRPESRLRKVTAAEVVDEILGEVPVPVLADRGNP